MMGKVDRAPIGTMDGMCDRLRSHAWAGGRGPEVTLHGEMLQPPEVGRFSELVLATDDASNPASYGTLSVKVAEVGGSWVDPKIGRGQAMGRVARVQGMLDVRNTGEIWIESAAVQTSRAFGPFTTWRRAQARSAGIEFCAARRSSLTNLADRLRSRVVNGRKVAWVGTDRIKAYRDATWGLDVGSRMDILGVPLQGAAVASRLPEVLQRLDPGDTAFVVISRGGGGAADLAPFDHRDVLHAVSECVARGLPVVCALGHELDRPLVELVASGSLGTPGHLRAFLASALFGQLTPEEERRKAQEKESELRSRVVAAESELRSTVAAADSAALRSTRQLESAAQALEAMEKRIVSDAQQRASSELELSRRSARDRLLRRNRLIGVELGAFACLAGGWLFLSGDIAPNQLAPWVAGAVVLAALLVWGTRGRLDRRPWVHRKVRLVGTDALLRTRTVGQYNAVVAYQQKVVPRLPAAWAWLVRKVRQR